MSMSGHNIAWEDGLSTEVRRLQKCGLITDYSCVSDKTTAELLGYNYIHCNIFGDLL